MRWVTNVLVTYSPSQLIQDSFRRDACKYEAVMHVYPNQTSLGSTGLQSKHQNIMVGSPLSTMFLRLCHLNRILWAVLLVANQSKRITKIHWHDFSCINAALFDFLRWIFFWPKIWPSLAKFGPIFGAKFFLLSRQEGICQYELNPKVWHFYLCQFKSYSTMCFQTIQGQCLFDLAAYKNYQLVKTCLKPYCMGSKY